MKGDAGEDSGKQTGMQRQDQGSTPDTGEVKLRTTCHHRDQERERRLVEACEEQALLIQKQLPPIARKARTWKSQQHGDDEPHEDLLGVHQHALLHNSDGLVEKRCYEW